LGTIAPGENAVAQLRFQVSGLNLSSGYKLIVDGRYRDGDERRRVGNRDDRIKTVGTGTGATGTGTTYSILPRRL
jgi:hypothetical protein